MSKLRSGWGAVKESTEKKTSKGGKNDQNTLFFRIPLKENTKTKHRVRLVGGPVTFNTIYHNRKRYIVPDDYVERVRHAGFKPRDTSAIQVFDREDTKEGITRLKILEKGNSIFEYFETYHEDVTDDDGNPVNPGGPDGPDWIITADVPSDIKQTSYKCTAMAAKPFSEAELELLNLDPNDEENKKKPLGQRGPIDLHDFYNLEKAAKLLEAEVLSEGGLDEDDAEDVDDSSDDSDDDDDIEEASEGEELSEEVRDVFR